MPISPLREPNLALDHAEETRRLIEQGQRAQGVVADPHAARVAAQAQAESAARRARMAATPGSSASTAAADSVAAKAASPVTRATAAATDVAKTAGSKLRSAANALRPSNLARTGLRAAGGLARPVAVASPLAGFGDYKANVAEGVDTSLAGTVRAAVRGDLPGVGASLSGGAAEALADSARGVAKTVDAVGGVFGAKPGATAALDDTIKNQFGGYLSLRNPEPAAGAGSTGVAAASPLRNQRPAAQGTYTTGEGRTGVLPAGITVAYGKNGPAFGGGQTEESQRLLQQGYGAPAAAASPLRAPDLNAMGSGFNQAPSRAGEINKYFDGLAKQIQDLHGSAKFGAKGTLATKLLELEKARANALGQNAGQLIDSQGNQVSDLGNKRSAAANIYGTDSEERSSLRRDNALVQSARVKAAADALQARQQMSEKQLELLDARATAAATDGEGKVDPAKKQAFIDAATVNFGGAFDGSAETLGKSAAEGADAATMAEVVGALNKGVGAGNESASLPKLGRLREPTLGEAFDSRSNVTLGDVARRAVDGLPFVDDSRVFEAEDPNERRVLRVRDTTRDQRQTLRRRNQLRDETEE